MSEPDNQAPVTPKEDPQEDIPIRTRFSLKGKIATVLILLGGGGIGIVLFLSPRMENQAIEFHRDGGPPGKIEAPEVTLGEVNQSSTIATAATAATAEPLPAPQTADGPHQVPAATPPPFSESQVSPPNDTMAKPKPIKIQGLKSFGGIQKKQAVKLLEPLLQEASHCFEKKWVGPKAKSAKTIIKFLPKGQISSLQVSGKILYPKKISACLTAAWKPALTLKSKGKGGKVEFNLKF